MLLLSNHAECWVLDLTSRTWGKALAPVGPHKFALCSSPEPEQVLPPDLDLHFDEHKADSYVDLLRNGQRIAELKFHSREEVTPLFVDEKVYLLGDTQNEVVDLASGVSWALPERDVGQGPWAVHCGPLVITVSTDGKMSIFDSDAWTWKSSQLDLGAEMQAMCASSCADGGRVFIKLPLTLVAFDLATFTSWQIDAPWLLNPQLSGTNEADSVLFEPTPFEPVRVAPSHVFDAEAKAVFKETGQTDNPAAVVSCCARDGDLDTMKQVLAKYEGDWLFSREIDSLGAHWIGWCPLHSVISSESRELEDIARRQMEARDAPRLYASPSDFRLDSRLGRLKHHSAEKWISLLRKVFVNADELI